MAEYEARFYTEAKAAGGLNHPNIIIIYDIGKSGHLVYMAMEYIQGKELREMLGDDKPLPVAQAVDVAAQVPRGSLTLTAPGGSPGHQACEHHDHARGAREDRRLRHRPHALERDAHPDRRYPRLSKYISPEQVVGKRADHRSDIFSLGVILYECITGPRRSTRRPVGADVPDH